VLSGDYDVWHLHWPDGLLTRPAAIPVMSNVSALMALLEIAHVRGVRRVWTIHNLRAHESLHPAIERRFWSWFPPRVEGYISLSDAVRSEALKRFPRFGRLPGCVIPHGTYRGLYPDELTRERARDRLRVSDESTVVVHLGQVRRYKDLPHL